MLTELSSEKFVWFGPSPIEPFNQGRPAAAGDGRRRREPGGAGPACPAPAGGPRGGEGDLRGPAGTLAKLAKSAKLANFLQIFGGLVLGCIKTKFCKKICV